MKKKNRVISSIIVFFMAINFCMDFFIYTVSALPLNKETTIIDVTDFGADPSGKTDSTVAIQKALEAVKEVDGHVTLSFPNGEYDFYKDYASKRQYHTSNTSSLDNPIKWIGILIEDQKDLTIEGNGSLFNMHGDIMAIAIVRSENVVLQNFVLDYEVPDTMDVTFVGQGEEDGKPYTDIYVPANYNYEISEDKKHITWLSEKSPYTGKPYWSDKDTLGGYLVIYKGYDETVRRHQTKVVYEGKEYLDADPFAGLEEIVEQGENILRFKYKDRRPNAQELGNVALLSNSARRRTAGAFIWESKDTLVKDIDVHYLSGFGWLTQMSENTEFNGVDFLPREGTGKYTTSNADQLHVSGASGYFRVIDCNFSMAHDDPINVHGTYLRVEEVVDDRTLKLKYIHSQQGGFPAYFPGDEVMFYSRLNLEVPTGANEEDTFTVKSAIDPGEDYNGQKLSMRESVVTFDKPFNEDVLNSLKVKIKRGTNPNANTAEEPLYVAENVTYAPDVHIKGNVMRSIPTRGILSTSRNEIIIEDNIFESLAMASIYLSNDADYWYESGPIRNMTIRNNTFNVRPTGQTEWGTVSPVFVDPVIVNQAVAAPGYTLPVVKGDPIHQNITIDNNTFNMAAFNLITAKGVKGFNFTNNKIVRDSVNMGLEVSTDNNNLTVGESTKVKAIADETILDVDAFIFENSKDINIENNTYDFGINMNVKLKGTDSSEVKIKGDKLSINGSPNIITVDDKVHLASLNPEVVKIDDDKNAVALKEGTAEIIAYYNWKGSLIKSEPIEINVVGGSKIDSLKISGDELIKTPNTSIKLTTDYTGEENVKWSVEDALTGLSTNGASIDENGNITGYKDGIYKVKASVAGVSSTKIVVVSLTDSFGIKGENNVALKEGFSIVEENSSKWDGNGEEAQVVITGEMGDLYGNNNSAKNIITYDIPDNIPKDDIRIQVTIDGLPKTGDNYNSAGVLLYKDKDNYVRLGTKGHQSNIALDNEVASKDVESTFGQNLTGRKATFEIEKLNGEIKVRYKDNDSNGKWSQQHTVGQNSGVGNDYKIAFAAWTKDIVPMIATFSNLKVGVASQVTTEDLEAKNGVAIFKAMPNNAPAIENATITENPTIGDTVNVTYDYVDVENHEERSALYAWTYIKDGNTVTEYTSTPSFKAKTTGKLESKIYVTDKYAKPNEEVITLVTEVNANSEESYLLKSLSINGNSIKEFDIDKYEYNYDIPQELNKFNLSYDLVNEAIGTVKIVDSKDIPLVESNGSYTLPEDKIVKILRLDGEEVKATYTINFISYLSNKAGISNPSIADKKAEVIKENTNSYFIALSDDRNIEKLSFDVDSGVKDVKVYSSFYMNKIDGVLEGNKYTTENIDLYSGLNIFNIDVTAEDGFVKRHRVHVFRSGYNDSYLTGINIGDKLIEGFDKDKTEYRVGVNSEEAKDLLIEASAVTDKDAKTSITVNGVRTEGGSRVADNLKLGLNTVVISVKAEDLFTTTNYTLNIIVESEENADLLDITSEDIIFSPEFNHENLNYTARTNKENITLTATTQHSNAKVQIIAGKEKFEGVSSATGTIKVYEGLNDVLIKVASPNKTIKTYTIVIDAKGYHYLSDLKADFVEIGYGNLELDKSSSSGTIRLPDENGNAISYEKGLGAHATSKLVYNIEGKGYTSFNSFVGIDYFQYNNLTAPSSVTFKVFLDEDTEAAWTSKEMKRDSAAVEVDLDITNVNKITLVADAGASNGYDHANWADAKFIKGMDKSPIEELIIELEKLIDKADAIDTSLYTNESVEVFKEYIESSKEVLLNPKSTYSEVGLAIIELTEAIDNLVSKNEPPIETDKTSLEIVISYAEDIKSNGALEEVVPAVVKEFEDALENAKSILANKNATEVQVDEASKRLINVIHMLDFKKGNKEQLEKLLTLINALDESKYIPATWSKLIVELEKANNVMADENALESEVRDVHNKLIKAYLDLRLVPDKSKLEELINKIKSIDTAKYTKQSINELSKKLKEANKILDNKEASQEEIEEAVKGLEIALSSLEVKQDDNGNESNNGNENNNGSSNENNNNNTNNSELSNNNDLQNNNDSPKKGLLPKTGGTLPISISIFSISLISLGVLLVKKKRN